MKISMAFVVFVLAAGPILAPGNGRAAPFLPDFTTATFVPGAPITNPYFPLADRKTRVFTGVRNENGETVPQRFELTNLGSGPTILGVPTTTRRDRGFDGGLKTEDTIDYFAQDTAGNVWYFGEDVTNYVYNDQGHLIGTNTKSSWRAGVNGALPGYQMPAEQSVGFGYYQEFAPADDAVDQALTYAVGDVVSIDLGTFENVLRVLETSAVEPDVREFKYYAPTVGLILVEDDLDADLTNPRATLRLTRVIPEPATLVLLAAGLVALARAAAWRATDLGTN